MKSRFFSKNRLINIVFIIFILGVVYYRFVIPNLDLNDIQTETLEGDQIDMALYKGKPLLVNFWASWCGNCLDEFPDIEEVKKQYGDRVQFVMISDESADRIKRFVNSTSYSFTFIRSKKEFSDYGINIRPCTYIYDADGNLVDKNLGAVDIEDIQEMIKQVL